MKLTAPSIAPSITNLFNVSIQTGCFPALWNTSNIVPVPKSNNHHEPSNYRPISLLPIVGKLIEHHIHFLITEHLSSCHPICESQWGFQVGKSTVSALLATTHDWLQHLEAGQDVCAVFFDLKKVFDSVPHRSLLHKLKLLNLHPVLIRWICSYLMGRAQRVVIDGESSEPIHVLSGVPQGSVLGPLLFLIYIDDVTACNLTVALSSLSMQMICCCISLLQFNGDYVDLQSDIDSLNNWVSSNHLDFNTSKCKFMLITRKKKPSHPPPLRLQSSSLEQVESIKYLGLLFSSDLSWAQHIDAICAKAKKVIGLCYRCFINIQAPSVFFNYISH